jgi:hypothetical protein
VPQFRGVAADESARGVKIAGHAVVDGAAHHGEGAAECIADFLDGAGLVARFRLQREDAERFALSLSVSDCGC